MRITGILSRAFLEKVDKKMYRCKICGENIFFEKETPKEKTANYHFFNKHRDLYMIAYRCFNDNDLENCIRFKIIKEKYK